MDPFILKEEINKLEGKNVVVNTNDGKSYFGHMSIQFSDDYASRRLLIGIKQDAVELHDIEGLYPI